MKELLIVMILVFVSAVQGYIRCKTCSGEPKMTDCYRTTICSDYEECYTKITVGKLGNDIYESGCMNKSVCSHISSGRRAAEIRRDSVACMECCNSDMCNNNLCNVHTVINPNFTECFFCNDVMKPEDCTFLTSCAKDYECSASMYLTSAQELRYRLGCLRSEVCHAISSVSQSEDYCVQCCNKPYCNSLLCRSVVKEKPKFITKPQDRIVQLNVSIALQCRPIQIDVLPVTVTWTHQTLNHTVTLPPVIFLENNEIVNMTVTKEHYGVWTCTLTNRNGAVSANATVSPTFPPFG